MPKYIDMQTENFGEFFSKCSTETVAGRAAAKSFGEHSARVLKFSWGAANIQSYSSDTTGADVHIKTAALPPAVASALVVLNKHDKIKKMTVKCVDVVSSNTGNNRGRISGVYTGEDGTLLSVDVDDDEQSKTGSAEMNLHIAFTKFTYENNLTSTSGILQTTNAGE